MNRKEARTAVKALYLQSAQLAGLEVSAESPDALADIIYLAFPKVDANRRPEAVANALRLIATTLDLAQENNQKTLFETSVKDAQAKVCPVYPFAK